MIIRNVRLSDLDRVTEIESQCFPKEEAASKEAFNYRIKTFPGSFLVIEDQGLILGHINGACSDAPFICDELFEEDGGHNDDGQNQMIFGLAVDPAYQKRGLAAKLLKALIEVAFEQKRKQVVLTCKEQLISYYERFGFVSIGISESTHGGAVWYDLVKYLEETKG